ncbi:MAG: murein biosynthesis integral membrane protein MurJ [Anaerolineae bacterium]
MTLESTTPTPGRVDAVPDVLAEGPAQETQAETNRGVARATGVLALGNISSRVLGLVREIVLTNLFGATAAVSAFDVATVVPKGLYDLLIGGHVNGAIIPVLSEIVTLKGKDELWRLVSVLLSMVTVVLAVLVLLIELAAPWIVAVVGGGLTGDTQALATSLLRLTSPALLFMSLFAVLSGTLYALRSFTWPAFATTVFNGVIVVVMLVFVPPQRLVVTVSSPAVVDWAFTRPDDAIIVAAVGWLAGSLAYLLLQLPGLRGARLRPTLRWRHPGIRQIMLLYIPVMFSLVLDVLVIRIFSYNLASQTGESSIAYMNRATTLIQFPQGLVATAISIAILPTLARQAALIKSNGDPKTFRDTLGLGMRLAITLILPATIGLFVLSMPIVALLFEHGAFTVQDTETVSLVLRLYLIGLPFAAVDLLLVYAFYARQDTLTPALVGLFSLSVYMVIALVLMPRYGLLSLMLADSAKHIIHAALSAYLLNWRMRGFGQQRFGLTIGKAGVAAAVMGIAAALLLAFLNGLGIDRGAVEEAILVMACGGLSVAVYVGLAYLFNIEEWRWLVEMVRARLRR